jgi:hypothetical protein
MPANDLRAHAHLYAISTGSGAAGVRLPMLGSLRMPANNLRAYASLHCFGGSANITILPEWLEIYKHTPTKQPGSLILQPRFMMNSTLEATFKSIKNKYSESSLCIVDTLDMSQSTVIQGSSFPFGPPYAPVPANSFWNVYSSRLEHLRLTTRRYSQDIPKDKKVKLFLARACCTHLWVPENIKLTFCYQNFAVKLEDKFNANVTSVIIKHAKRFLQYLQSTVLTETNYPISKFAGHEQEFDKHAGKFPTMHKNEFAKLLRLYATAV